MVLSKSTVALATDLPPIDERIKTMFINNLAAAIQRGDAASEVHYDIPESLRAHGYTGVAKLMGVADHTVRHYWQTDLRAGRSQYMPQPDVIIHRVIQRADGTEEIEVLPGWTENTIRNWMPVRVGTGNHTRGENRKGNPHGRRGWTKEKAAAKAAEDELANAPA